jgi:hypothetical protein
LLLLLLAPACSCCCFLLLPHPHVRLARPGPADRRRGEWWPVDVASGARSDHASSPAAPPGPRRAGHSSLSALDIHRI